MSIVEFYKIDVDTNGEVSEAYSITRMPSLIFVRNSKTMNRLAEPDINTMREYVEYHR